MKTYELNVNGHLIKAQFDEQNIQNIFIPLLKKWTQMQKEKNSKIIDSFSCSAWNWKNNTFTIS